MTVKSQSTDESADFVYFFQKLEYSLKYLDISLELKILSRALKFTCGERAFLELSTDSLYFKLR